ncbi:hypothetical protein NC652_026237 [Populus alba x Populus x berolinensis]|uniref:Uncharacterized protein n=1 Tax=Populus alba x Populus x berolinensis TaxID=444605 RepID=A0AAD6MC73_9ROSI|nr:hypothetical protein NC652_026237 [Populus alba x Populus x berolinensis]KAJ6982833.1 hypothetical protein NC653_025826 [Populus alba x Populus x berolinensis]
MGSNRSRNIYSTGIDGVESLVQVSPIERWKKIERQRLPVVKKGLGSIYLPCQVQSGAESRV